MARFANILIPASEGTARVAVSANSTSAKLQLGANRIFVINSDHDVNITFGANATITTPDATAYRIPANQQTTFDLGSASDTIELFNPSLTLTANVFIQLLSVQ
jgi:hypothetical protein